MYNTKEGKSCVIYIRVSSERQVKGIVWTGRNTIWLNAPSVGV